MYKVLASDIIKSVVCFCLGDIESLFNEPDLLYVTYHGFNDDGFFFTAHFESSESIFHASYNVSSIDKGFGTLEEFQTFAKDYPERVNNILEV